MTRPYQAKLGSPRQGNTSWDVQLAEGDEVPGLEDILYETLKDAVKIGDLLPGILSELAYHHWLDFFEAFPANSEPGIRHDSVFLWQLSQSLEQNLDTSKYLQRQDKMAGSANYPDWQCLVDRIERRVELSLLAVPCATSTTTGSVKSLRSSAHVTHVNVRSRTGSGNAAAAGSNRGSSVNEDPNQRSLNRVAYLGGVLLPFTVVSGILSMNDQYSPTSSDFWIFWVASVATSAACLLIIYLDQLRGLEVWFEIAANDAVDALFQPTHIVRTHSSRLVSTRTGRDGTIVLQSLVGPGGGLPNVYTNGKNEVVVDMPVPSGDGGDGVEEVLADSEANPTILVQRRSDGSQPKAWKRGQLGWAGAVKKVVGYYRWRGSTPVQFNPPGLDRFRMNTI